MVTRQPSSGHRRLNTTMTYARVHDKTVAADYFRAMAAMKEFSGF